MIAIMIATCLSVFFFEIILRFGLFLWFDYNEYYLYYGVRGIYITQGKTAGYYKFRPLSVLRGIRGQSSETASINSLGFRGPEFRLVKPSGVFRVICMGESSTFGFHNGDEGTYPFLLEKLFRQKERQMRVEVINAGFPHYNSGNIVSLLEEELLGYRPDVLTLYAGANEAGWTIQTSALERMMSWLRQRSVAFFWIDQFKYTVERGRVFRRIAKALSRDMDPVEFDGYLSQVAARYRKNVRGIVGFARKNNIAVVLIKQAMTSHWRYAGLSYEGEYRSIMDKFHKRRRLESMEVVLLGHHRLMEELGRIATEERLPMVDNIGIVDQDRRRLASWVHLTEEGNLRLAEALRRRIEGYLDSAERVETRGAMHKLGSELQFARQEGRGALGR